ncbi:MAG: peptidyl-prolyl cis-trans isomerase [Thermoanaerobaculia bacterium]
MKATSFGTILLVALTMVLPARSSVAESNRIVLRVNDRIATFYDYERLKREQLRNIARSGASEEERQRRIADAGVETMRTMFEEMLYLSRADQLDVRVPPSELQEALQRTKESFGIRTDEEYDEALRQSGMTRDDLRTQIENSLRMREVFSLEVYSQIVVQEEDLRRYYGSHPEEFSVPAAVKLREVVVLDDSGLDEVARQGLANALKDAIEAGEAEATLLESESNGSTTGWIDLDWVEAGDLDPQLEASIADLEAGEVSQPTAARGGLHLLQLVERREESLQEFGEVREAIDAAETDRRFQKRLAEYLSELEDQAFIVAHPPPDAAGFRVQEGSQPASQTGSTPGPSSNDNSGTEGG